MSAADIIGIYAAIVSSALLLWEIWKYKQEQRSKLRVVLSPYGWTEQEKGTASKNYLVDIFNLSKFPVSMDMVVLRFDIEKHAERFAVLHEDNIPMPQTIQPAGRLCFHFPQTLLDSRKTLGATKVRAIVFGTNKKEFFKSEWINLDGLPIYG